jgi:hypothetical protein
MDRDGEAAVRGSLAVTVLEPQVTGSPWTVEVGERTRFQPLNVYTRGRLRDVFGGAAREHNASVVEAVGVYGDDGFRAGCDLDTAGCAEHVSCPSAKHREVRYISLFIDGWGFATTHRSDTFVDSCASVVAGGDDLREG